MNEFNVQQLKQSPMFHFSMSSLELFHSNFLAWLFVQDIYAFLECFGVEVKDDMEYVIDREYNLGTSVVDGKDKKWITDIAVFAKYRDNDDEKSKGRLELIVENKIKSLPSNGQLKQQDALADKCNRGIVCKKVLLTLFDLPEAYPLYGFTSLRYVDLVDKIRDHYESSAYFDPYIKDYCEMIDILQQIINDDDVVQHNRQGYLTFHERSNDLEACGMQDAFRKYQAAQLVQRAFAEFGEKYSNGRDAFELVTGASLNHKRACTDIFLQLNKNLRAGVQIEHDQFRVCFTGKALERRFDRTGKLSADSYVFLNEFWNELLNNISGGKKNYCKYGRDFVYRYAIIPRGVTLEQLFKDGNWLDDHSELSVKYVLDKMIDDKGDLLANICK